MGVGFGVASAGRILIAVVLVWLLLIFFIGGPLFKRGDPELNGINGENGEMILARLSRATSELNSLKAQNDELRKLLDNLLPIKSLETKLHEASNMLQNSGDLSAKSKESGCGPSTAFEQTRRQINSNFDEIWYYLRKSLNSSQLDFFNQHRYSMLYDLDQIAARDKEWRKKELSKLSGIISKTIEKLQNPESCGKARKVVCQLNKGCGFGCQIHHVVYCFVVALATKRTLILDAHNWRYSHPKDRKSKNSGWDLVFQPLSETCISDAGDSRGSWKDGHENVQVLDLPIIDSMRPRPRYLPLAIPEELAPKLKQLHGSPIAWFLGQIVRYIMRPSTEMQAYIKEAKYNFQFRGPIVGIHVRRTDKVGTEAAYHSLSEYMSLVQDYFNKLDTFQQRAGNEKGPKIERLVYLATDDPAIWTKEARVYEDQGYTFIGDSDIAQTAGIGRRYSVESLRNIILDILLLSESDRLVCTFSSQVCRLAYELMQTRGLGPSERTQLDWSSSFSSLDDIYYFGGQHDHNQIAILNHKAANGQEIDLKIGEIIGIAGNHWNGFSKGMNRVTHQNGLYPSFKAVEKIDTVPFKAFENLKET